MYCISNGRNESKSKVKDENNRSYVSQPIFCAMKPAVIVSNAHTYEVKSQPQILN